MIENGEFTFGINQESVATEAVMGGIYLIRAGVDQQDVSAPSAVKVFTNQLKGERAFSRMHRASTYKSAPSIIA